MDEAPDAADAPDLDRVAARLRPLGSPVRLRLLRFLQRPHYLEEIATHLHMNRFAAKRHVDALVTIGILRAQPGARDTGPVREYLVAPEAIFELYDAVRVLGALRPARDLFAETRPAVAERTRAGSGSVRQTGTRSEHPFLVVVYGARIGHAFPLPPRRGATPAWVVGRDSGADVVLDTDPFVSTRHARIARHGPEFVLTDTYSTNGTWVNWDRLPEGESRGLRSGDVVGVGKTLLVFGAAAARVSA